MEIEGSGKVMAEKGNKKREESMRDVRTALEAGIEEVGGGVVKGFITEYCSLFIF